MILDLTGLENVDLSYPVVEAGLYAAKVVSAAIEEKPDLGTRNLVVKVALLALSGGEPMPLRKGGFASPGLTITRHIPLTGTRVKGDKSAANRVPYDQLPPVGSEEAAALAFDPRKGVKKFAMAFGIEGGQLDLAALAEKQLTVRVTVRPEREENGTVYPESNDIDWIVSPKE